MIALPASVTKHDLSWIQGVGIVFITIHKAFWVEPVWIREVIFVHKDCPEVVVKLGFPTHQSLLPTYHPFGMTSVFAGIV